MLTQGHHGNIGTRHTQVNGAVAGSCAMSPLALTFMPGEAKMEAFEATGAAGSVIGDDSPNVILLTALSLTEVG